MWKVKNKMHWYGVYVFVHFADLWYLCSQKWLSASGRKQRGFCTKGRPVCGGPGLSPSCEMACSYKANQDHTIPSRLGIPGLPRKEDTGEWMCVYINGKKCCYVILIVFHLFSKEIFSLALEADTKESPEKGKTVFTKDEHSLIQRYIRHKSTRSSKSYKDSSFFSLFFI